MTNTEKFAKDFAEDVFDAFAKAYGQPRNPEVADSVYPSWSDAGIKLGWADPDPRVVVVGTESGWISDPFSHENDHGKWESVCASLRKVWGNVQWDSINAGVHIVFIDISPEWMKLIVKRSVGKKS